MKNLSICILAILLFSGESLWSQDFAKKGIWEIGGRISYTSETSVSNGETSENSFNTFMLNVPVYYFVIEGLEVGLVPGYQYSSFGDNSISLIQILAGIAYNLQTQSVAYPYLEGRFGYNSVSNGSSRGGMIWLLSGGVKVQAGGTALIGLGIFYEQRTIELSSYDGDRVGTNTWGVDVGFAVFLVVDSYQILLAMNN